MLVEAETNSLILLISEEMLGEFELKADGPCVHENLRLKLNAERFVLCCTVVLKPTGLI